MNCGLFTVWWSSYNKPFYLWKLQKVVVIVVKSWIFVLIFQGQVVIHFSTGCLTTVQVNIYCFLHLFWPAGWSIHRDFRCRATGQNFTSSSIKILRKDSPLAKSLKLCMAAEWTGSHHMYPLKTIYFPSRQILCKTCLFCDTVSSCILFISISFLILSESLK